MWCVHPNSYLICVAFIPHLVLYIFTVNSQRQNRLAKGTGAGFYASVPLQNKKNDWGRVQERGNGDLYPIRAGKRTETGYRRRKRAICTRFEQEIERKPGTGEGKVRSVPDRSRKTDGNRVQEQGNGDLYPIRVGNRSEIGYRRRESAICTLAVREAWWREVCVLIKGVCFGSIEWYCECTLQA